MSKLPQAVAGTQPPVSGGSWPTAEQELLLKAALFRGNAFDAAWREWRSRVDIERLDIASHRLLPLLCRNLKQHGVEDDWLPRIKGVYRQSWYKNKLLFNRGAQLLRQLQAAGVRTLLLKGAVLSKVYYEDDGARAMTDFDLLVPAAQAGLADETMKQHGWRAKTVYPIFGRKYRIARASLALPLMHACCFADRDGYEADLHWSLFFERRHRQADDEFWTNAQPIEFEGVPTLMLDATDQLFHVCVHGAEWNAMPPCRWVADALMIVRRAPQIEWQRMAAHAERLRLVPALRDTLAYLQRAFQVEVPASMLQQLHLARFSESEELAYRLRLSPDQQALCSVWQRLWVDHLRTLPQRNQFVQLLHFPRYCVRRALAMTSLIRQAPN
ncbi:MAG TPA: nucleotidyltransferase family protein [Blastocatellia bacterium]